MTKYPLAPVLLSVLVFAVSAEAGAWIVERAVPRPWASDLDRCTRPSPAGPFYEPLPSSHCVMDWNWFRINQIVTADFDSRSLRISGPRADAREPASAADSHGILFIGDSQTFGLVDAADTWPEVLARQLGGDLQALNAGVPGYNTDLILERAGHLFGTIRPAQAVWGLYLFDVLRPRLTHDRGRLVYADLAARLRWSSALYRIFRVIKSRAFLPPPRPVEEELVARAEYGEKIREPLAAAIGRFGDLCTRYQVRCRIVDIPLLVWNDRDTATTPAGTFTESARESAAKAGIPIRSGLEAFKDTRAVDARIAPQDLHLSAAANRRLGEWLAEHWAD